MDSCQRVVSVVESASLSTTKLRWWVESDAMSDLKGEPETSGDKVEKLLLGTRVQRVALGCT
jgi:hypothetical protein